MCPGKRSRKKARGRPDKNLPGLVWFNKGLVELRWEKRLPRLVVHSKYERRVKWLLRLLAVVGILSALISMGPAAGLAFSVGLFLVEQFFERTIFRYTTIVVTPIPDFRVRHEDVAGMAFGWPQHGGERDPDMCGLCFMTEELASKFFDQLREINYGEREDKDDNIKLTFVWSNRWGGKGYYVCMFPRPDRKGVQERFEHHRKEGYGKHPGMEQHELVIMWTFLKHFGGGMRLREFLARQRPGRPFWLQAFRMNEAGKNEILFDVKPILKWHFRVVHENDLKSPGEVEYGLVFQSES